MGSYSAGDSTVDYWQSLANKQTNSPAVADVNYYYTPTAMPSTSNDQFRGTSMTTSYNQIARDVGAFCSVADLELLYGQDIIDTHVVFTDESSKQGTSRKTVTSGAVYHTVQRLAADDTGGDTTPADVAVNSAVIQQNTRLTRLLDGISNLAYTYQYQMARLIPCLLSLRFPISKRGEKTAMIISNGHVALSTPSPTTSQSTVIESLDDQLFYRASQVDCFYDLSSIGGASHADINIETELNQSRDILNMLSDAQIDFSCDLMLATEMQTGCRSWMAQIQKKFSAAFARIGSYATGNEGSTQDVTDAQFDSDAYNNMLAVITEHVVDAAKICAHIYMCSRLNTIAPCTGRSQVAVLLEMAQKAAWAENVNLERIQDVEGIIDRILFPVSSSTDLPPANAFIRAQVMYLLYALSGPKIRNVHQSRASSARGYAKLPLFMRHNETVRNAFASYHRLREEKETFKDASEWRRVNLLLDVQIRCCQRVLMVIMANLRNSPMDIVWATYKSNKVMNLLSAMPESLRKAKDVLGAFGEFSKSWAGLAQVSTYANVTNVAKMQPAMKMTRALMFSNKYTFKAASPEKSINTLQYWNFLKNFANFTSNEAMLQYLDRSIELDAENDLVEIK